MYKFEIFKYLCSYMMNLESWWGMKEKRFDFGITCMISSYRKMTYIWILDFLFCLWIFCWVGHEAWKGIYEFWTLCLLILSKMRSLGVFLRKPQVFLDILYHYGIWEAHKRIFVWWNKEDYGWFVISIWHRNKVQWVI